jgi:cytochrome o ubiquinol oxidase subunit 1
MLPGFGMLSELVPVFSQKRLFGYTSMVLATMVITILSFGVWVHHFFTMGAGANVNAFFGIATMAIAIPTGVKVFNWLFTMFRGRIRYESPMLWFMGFLFSFILGGATGVLMSVPPADFQLHNSLFLVAHFHNMVIGGVLFSYFAGFAYWFPKLFGFGLHEKLGKLAFWLWIGGFAIAFIPLYILGFMGMTRRLDFVDLASGYHPLLVVAAVGACLIALAVAAQVLMLAVSIFERRKRRDTKGDYWNGRTLEWAVASPAPAYNFAHIPQVTSRDAFWEMKRDGHLLAHGPYEDIALPKNSFIGLLIAFLAFLFGFGMIWHLWWLLPIALGGIITTVIVRSFSEDTEYIVTAAEVARTEAKHHHSYA